MAQAIATIEAFKVWTDPWRFQTLDFPETPGICCLGFILSITVFVFILAGFSFKFELDFSFGFLGIDL